MFFIQTFEDIILWKYKYSRYSVYISVNGSMDIQRNKQSTERLGNYLKSIYLILLPSDW